MLVIDTASRPGFLGLWQGEEWLQLRAFSHGRRQGEEIFPFLEQALASAKLRLEDLAGLTVATGPGSFSALRVGLGTAKSLCETSGLALCGVSLLDAAAAVAPGQRLAVLLLASRADVYIAAYDAAGDMLQPAQVLALAEWRCPDGWMADAVVAGSPSLAAAAAEHSSLAKVPIVVVEEHLPRLLAAKGWQRLRSGNLDSPMTLDALYVRRQNAGDAWMDPQPLTTTAR